MRRSRSPKQGLEVVYERRRGAISALSVAGHAGFAGAGQDIVCAAVSALVLSATEGLRRHCEIKPTVLDTPQLFRVELADGGNSRAQAVLATAVSGLKAIAKSYPGYLRVRSRPGAATGPRSRPAKPQGPRAG